MWLHCICFISCFLSKRMLNLQKINTYTYLKPKQANKLISIIWICSHRRHTHSLKSKVNLLLLHVQIYSHIHLHLHTSVSDTHPSHLNPKLIISYCRTHTQQSRSPGINTSTQSWDFPTPVTPRCVSGSRPAPSTLPVTHTYTTCYRQVMWN